MQDVWELALLRVDDHRGLGHRSVVPAAAWGALSGAREARVRGMGIWRASQKKWSAGDNGRPGDPPPRGVTGQRAAPDAPLRRERSGPRCPCDISRVVAHAGW